MRRAFATTWLFALGVSNCTWASPTGTEATAAADAALPAESRALADGVKRKKRPLFNTIEDTRACGVEGLQRGGSPDVHGHLGDDSSDDIDKKCQQEVLPKYGAGADSKVKVMDVKRTRLDCDALRLRADMPSLDFAFRGVDYTAARNSYDYFAQFEGRHVWTGELTGDATGAVTVVWNDECDPQVFHLLAALGEDADGRRNTLRTVPCADGACTWLAALKADVREEYEGKRRLVHVARREYEGKRRSAYLRTAAAPLPPPPPSAAHGLEAAAALNTNERAPERRAIACRDCSHSCLILRRPRPRRDTRRTTAAAAAAAQRSAADPEAAAALDADIELLRLMSEGDGDAHDVFHRAGGRRLEGEGAVVMPSGRRLDDGSIVRVLFAYTPASRARWGAATLKSMIVGGVASANQVLSNSGLGFKIEAAAIMATTYTEPDGGFVAALNDLDDGNVTGVNAARETYKADLVQLVINTSDYCGSNCTNCSAVCAAYGRYGNIMTSTSSDFAPWAHSVVYNGCYSSYSHIHEMGHNMGAQHDAANSQDVTDWSYGEGYRYCSGETSQPWFRSVMSYNCGAAPRVPYFSSPNVYYKGRATGTAGADNVRVLKANRYTVANFRQ
ncbi:hypothetical protein JKP88DRAFT_249749 [Tribonema minus]|uniref:Peptidyl-Asp metalloendopeptidase n=1 Tax=Tribonema minus TaxID=303371 RepID=A0A836C7N3_9STRA|nr:hypothetical protein JKP88DRAFT_249749 [Tribonema minus]